VRSEANFCLVVGSDGLFADFAGVGDEPLAAVGGLNPDAGGSVTEDAAGLPVAGRGGGEVDFDGVVGLVEVYEALGHWRGWV
jgi:hypothetical protein